MTSAEGMTAFVPNGDSARDTAILLLGAAADAGLDNAVVASPSEGGFYISDELADALGADPDTDEHEQESDEDEPDEQESETEKAVDQLEAEKPPVENADEVVDAAVDPPAKPAKKAAKKTSGNRAVKQDSEEE